MEVIHDERNPYLSAVPLNSIEERMKEKPVIFEALTRLRSLIGDDKYKKHVSTAKNINFNGGTLLILADSFFQRTMLERDCVPHLKEAFGAKRVQITC